MSLGFFWFTSQFSFLFFFIFFRLQQFITYSKQSEATLHFTAKTYIKTIFNANQKIFSASLNNNNLENKMVPLTLWKYFFSFKPSSLLSHSHIYFSNSQLLAWQVLLMKHCWPELWFFFFFPFFSEINCWNPTFIRHRLDLGMGVWVIQGHPRIGKTAWTEPEAKH